ncbi:MULTISPECIES: hypothetical protein [Amycolatopsis]|uniref:Uncharacterized protein n=2 Tax=Amycolatopsis TaxID=1813 RepID=A0ABW5I4J6_9PSEU
MIEHTVRLTGVPGTFQASSFTEWIGHLVDVTGLDPALHHVLKAVENTEDGTASTLTIVTIRDDGPDLAAAMSVRVGTPTCPVRAFVAGTQVSAAQMEAPLQVGAPVRVGDQHYTVQAVSYPARQPDGTTTGDDYQRADLVAADGTPFDVRTLGGAPAALAGLFGGA